MLIEQIWAAPFGGSRSLASSRERRSLIARGDMLVGNICRLNHERGRDL